jgi:hypothetical protein
MLVNKYGRVAGSIDLATLAQMYAQATDDDLKAHYREVAAESGVDLDESAEASEVQPQPEVETEAEVEEQPEEDLDALRAQAEELGIKVDGRWGAERLRQEIDEAS